MEAGIPSASSTSSMTKLLTGWQPIFSIKGCTDSAQTDGLFIKTPLSSFWLMSQTTWSGRGFGSASDNTLQPGDKLQTPLEGWARLYMLNGEKKLDWAKGQWSFRLREWWDECKRGMQTLYPQYISGNNGSGSSEDSTEIKRSGYRFDVQVH